MRRTSFAHWPCQIARTMDLLGDWWTPLVLREAYYGLRRFDEFQQGLGIARTTLSDRLGRLVEEGLLEKQVYQTEPTRYEYVLTEKGQDFFPVLVAMMRWGDRWLNGPEGPPVVLHHEACGHDTEPDALCSACGERLAVADMSMHPGPGYPARLIERPDIKARFERVAPGRTREADETV
ncbi:winged helix-turn-helix transcriptional regulator [Yinghuangia seranimata]|uniref:winged helix-turn-helix transcriptional regulator n=1 Tax=Yinghuangia seranimata TaxID=408067 RepID=UPI00248AA6A0|nr:helix-turn-helix domain-containing protein [Yinghuangia seranimata]MDI2124963.1 helix-turn-helix domain-containing protein [Yinghuangia seranimata]